MMKVFLTAFVATATFSTTNAFVPIHTKAKNGFGRRYATEILSGSVVSVDKPTGTSFLPEETLERAKNGSPIEKAKLEKDPVNAWVDVYEYARKIREGEMTWEEVEKADLDTVRRSLRQGTNCRVIFTLSRSQKCFLIVS
jgi:hypothetical protein